MKLKTREQRYRELSKLADDELNASVIEYAENYLKDFPDSKGAWSIYSISLQNLSKVAEAKKALLKAIELYTESDENLAWLLNRMGHIYENSGNFPKAIEWYRKAHNHTPKEATFLIYLGLTFLHLGKYDEAEEALTEATQCKEGCIDEAFYNLGVVKMFQKKYEKAQEYFEKSLEIDPKYKEAKQQLKDVKKVLEVLEKVKPT